MYFAIFCKIDGLENTTGVVDHGIGSALARCVYT